MRRFASAFENPAIYFRYVVSQELPGHSRVICAERTHSVGIDEMQASILNIGLKDAMSPSTDGNDGAAEGCIRSPETGALFVASPPGAVRSSDTTSPAEEHTLEIESELSRLDESIAETPTKSSLSVNPGVSSSPGPARASNPEGTYTA